MPHVYLKKMLKRLLLLTFIACATSTFQDTAALEDFLKELRSSWQKTTCQKASQSQASTPSEEFEKCLQDTNQLAAEVISEYRPIALQVLEDAASNVNHTYYQIDPETKRWTLGNQQVPATVDGDKENVKTLTAALDFEFKDLIYSKMTQPDNERFVGGLDKRGWASSLAKSWDDIAKNVGKVAKGADGAVDDVARGFGRATKKNADEFIGNAKFRKNKNVKVRKNVNVQNAKPPTVMDQFRYKTSRVKNRAGTKVDQAKDWFNTQADELDEVLGLKPKQKTGFDFDRFKTELGDEINFQKGRFKDYLGMKPESGWTRFKKGLGFEPENGWTRFKNKGKKLFGRHKESRLARLKNKFRKSFQKFKKLGSKKNIKKLNPENMSPKQFFMVQTALRTTGAVLATVAVALLIQAFVKLFHHPK
jgi:hypothetical protein